MNWGTSEECHCPSTVWGRKNFWPRWYTKKVLDTLSNFALKNALYSVSIYRSLFNLVKDLFKWIEGLGRSVTVRVQSEGERIFDLGGVRKKYLIRCQISRSKTLYIVFQHKSLFKLVKDLFKWIEGQGRSVTVRVQSEGESFFDLVGIRQKYLIRCQISRSKTRYIVFQHKSLFNLVKDLFKWIEGLVRSVTFQVQSEGERIFDLGGIRKKYLIRCQISRSKTRYIKFQHKSLFSLVKGLFKWIEDLGRSVTVRVQSEGERVFDLSGIRKKYLIRCQISRSKTRYIVFQHKSLFHKFRAQNICLCIFISDFQFSQGVVQMNWGFCRSVIILVRYERELNFFEVV